MGEPDGLLQKYSPGGADISAPSAEHSELGDSPGRGVEDCSELRDSPGLLVGGCSALGDSPGEQVRFGLACGALACGAFWTTGPAFGTAVAILYWH